MPKKKNKFKKVQTSSDQLNLGNHVFQSFCQSNCLFFQEQNVFQWNKSLILSAFMLLNSQRKAAEGNLNLSPSAWGQLRPYGLLDPAQPSWCEVSWSDASLAASLLSKETVRVSYSPRSCSTVVVKLLYILNSEQGRGKHSLRVCVVTVVHQMLPHLFS